MAQTEMQRYRERLLQMQSELEELAQTSQDATRTVELDQASVGRLSRMDAMQAQQMAQEAARRREIQLQRIAGALRRIDAGEFGACFVCGEDIDQRRLDADPTLTRCIGCSSAE